MANGLETGPLARRFRTEHQAIRADIDQLRTAADTLDEPGAITRVRQAHATLTGEVWPHESAEEDELYPSLNRILGGADPTAPMSRAHAEIAYQIARLGRLTEDIGDREPDTSETAELRSALYGLHAILALHTVQEGSPRARSRISGSGQCRRRQDLASNLRRG